MEGSKLESWVLGARCRSSRSRFDDGENIMDQAVKEVRRPLSDADRKAVQALLAGDKSLPAKLKANPNSRGVYEDVLSTDESSQ
jgi:hypothetical protein